MMKFLWIAITITACAASKPAATRPHELTELAGRRAQMIGWLHDYERAGVYPTDASGMPISVFRDDKGVRCPMAELIHKSGRDDLVDAVVAENNTVRLAEVHDGPLHDWMLGSGLTEAEIAMVQGALTPGEERAMMNALFASAEVHGRLQMAETALRDGTAHSLDVAATKLPRDRDLLAKAPPVAGRVTPAPKRVAIHN